MSILKASNSGSQATQATTDVSASSSAQQIMIHRFYIKSSVFEAVVMTPALLKMTQPPVTDMQIQANYNERDKTLYEAVLTLDLIARQNDDRLWRVQLSQAGLFTLTGFTEERREMVLNGYCMNLLYPYVCEAASTMVARGGFPPLYLAPMNFEVLYREQQAAKKAEAKRTLVEEQTY